MEACGSDRGAEFESQGFDGAGGGNGGLGEDFMNKEFLQFSENLNRVQKNLNAIENVVNQNKVLVTVPYRISPLGIRPFIYSTKTPETVSWMVEKGGSDIDTILTIDSVIVVLEPIVRPCQL